MATVEQLEQRVTDLEKTVADLHARAENKGSVPDWVVRVSGIISNPAAFEKAMEYAREDRRSDLPEESDEVAEPRNHLLVDPTDPNWIEKIKGCMKDEPDFAEIIRLGREFRESDCNSEDGSP